MPTQKFTIEILSGVPIIREKDLVILVDTGSPQTVHAASALNFLGKTFAVQTRIGSFGVQSLSDYFDFNITTLLGMDILKDYTVVFDYQNNELSLISDENFEPAGEQIALTSAHGIPVLNVNTPDQVVPMFFDTGAKLSYLKRALTRDFKNLGEVEDFYPTIGKFTTTKYLIYCQIGSKSLDIAYGNLPVKIEHLLSLINGNNGILGYDFISNFKLCLDMKKMSLTIMD